MCLPKPASGDRICRYRSRLRFNFFCDATAMGCCCDVGRYESLSDSPSSSVGNLQVHGVPALQHASPVYWPCLLTCSVVDRHEEGIVHDVHAAQELCVRSDDLSSVVGHKSTGRER